MSFITAYIFSTLISVSFTEMQKKTCFGKEPFTIIFNNFGRYKLFYINYIFIYLFINTKKRKWKYNNDDICV